MNDPRSTKRATDSSSSTPTGARGHAATAAAAATSADDDAAVELVGRFHARLFGAYLIALNIALIWLLVSLWPHSVPLDPGDASPVELFGSIELTVAAETRLLLIVVFAGALGSYIHLATSFADFTGNRRLVRSWLMWYALRPFIGTALAVIVYFALRGGLLLGANTTSALSPYGIAAVAALTGMFSRQAGDKLREVFENFFQTENPVGRADPLPTGAAERRDAAAEDATAAAQAGRSGPAKTAPADDASPAPPVHAGDVDER